jgi:formylglycine-generating enzyme required for sulfatase activity
MIRKATAALALILLALAICACGTKEEAEPQAADATSAASTPTITPGEMVLIPAGEYTIGTDERDPQDKKSFTLAYPEHKVKLPAFWIDKYEVTMMEYLEFTANTGYVAEGEAEGKTWRTFFSTEKPYNPVVYITFKDAEAYCKAKGRRLPTEFEWEAAARGLEGVRFPWGNEWVDNKTNTAEAGFKNPQDIGKFDDVNALGVHDMFGNVQEWTSSWFRPYPGNKRTQDFNSAYRVVRGLGSRYTGNKYNGLWARSAYQPQYLADFGCRCAKDATPEEAAQAPSK